MTDSITTAAGTAPFIADDTRAWVSAYTVGNKVKPSMIFRAATDSNFIRDQFITLPAYGNTHVHTQAMCNIIGPGQRLPGVLTWSVTESLDNPVDTAQVELLDALPQSRITSTIQGFGIGTKNSAIYQMQWTASTVTGGDSTYRVAANSALPARYHSPIIRFQWVRDGNGIALQLPGINYDSLNGNSSYGSWIPGPRTGNHPVKAWTDGSINAPFVEENLIYRMYEPEIIYINLTDMVNFPDPAVPYEETEGEFLIENGPTYTNSGGGVKNTGGGLVGLGQSKDTTLDSVNEWWELDYLANINTPIRRGIGAYYILVNQEVMKVTMIDRAAGALYVVPGGRGAAGTIQSHNIGDTVTLLGQQPFNGMWAGFGYLGVDSFAIEQSIMRPGNCYVSYEGYGNAGDYRRNGVQIPLDKNFDRQKNIQFTGYWFVTQVASELDNTGVPKATISLASSEYVLSQQQINPDTLIRMSNQLQNWALTTFDDVFHNRIGAAKAGNVVDFTAWDPALPGAYPMQIFVEFAQHQAFFQHMQDTDFGRHCEWCMKEWIDFVQNKEHGVPTGSIREAHSVGKHIYQESIRVFNGLGTFNAGPLKTYGRLMTALAIAAWEHPLIGNNLGQRWTKLPNALFNAMTNWTNGRTWNGQLGFRWYDPITHSGSGPDPDLGKTTNLYDYSFPNNDDKFVYGTRIDLTCPFSASYDRQPWNQPMADLASLNRMTYKRHRRGYPMFIPIGHKLRGCPANIPLSNFNSGNYPYTTSSLFLDPETNVTVADEDKAGGEWHLSYGGSIDQFQQTIDPTGVLTLCYVSCSTAFGDGTSGGSEATFTIPGAGTGTIVSNNTKNTGAVTHVWYSSAVGNKEGLKLTGGVQQTDTVSLDNLQLGLSWNTRVANYSLTVVRDGSNIQNVQASPALTPPTANGKNLNLSQGSKDANDHPEIVSKIQQFCNFMMDRRYIGPAVFDDHGQLVYQQQLNENGKWDGALTGAVKGIQRFLNNAWTNSTTRGSSPWPTFADSQKWAGTMTVNGTWDMKTYKAAKAWVNQNAEGIKVDIWWYVQNGFAWDQYVAAVVGLKVPEIRSPSDNSQWIVDQTALKSNVEQWMIRFYKDAVNYANSVVDESINKAMQQVITTNYADPRIMLGDVIWAEVPGYMSSSNNFGNTQRPFTNGMYINAITRSLDLAQGSYQGTYTGYRYRGYFDSSLMNNPSNYCTYNPNPIQQVV